jgi:hypothetical protein
MEYCGRGFAVPGRPGVDPSGNAEKGKIKAYFLFLSSLIFRIKISHQNYFFLENYFL